MSEICVGWPGLDYEACLKLITEIKKRAERDAAGKVAGEHDPEKRAAIATEARDWLAWLQRGKSATRQ